MPKKSSVEEQCSHQIDTVAYKTFPLSQGWARRILTRHLLQCSMFFYQAISTTIHLIKSVVELAVYGRVDNSRASLLSHGWQEVSTTGNSQKY